LLQEKAPHLLKAIGNKNPRYYFGLDRLVRQGPDLRLIVITRSHREFIPSWNQRAWSQKDNAWFEGQLGLFGVMELLQLLLALLRQQREIMLVRYEHLFFGNWRSVLEQVCEFLSMPFSEEFGQRFVAHYYDWEGLRKKKRSLLANEMSFCERLRVDELESVLSRFPVCRFDVLAEELQEHIDRNLAARPELVGDFAAAVDEYDKPATNHYWYAFLSMFAKTEGPTILDIMDPARRSFATLGVHAQRLAALRRLDESVDVLLEVISQRPDVPEFYRMCAHVENRRSQPDRAETLLRRYLELAPDSARGFRLLSGVLAKQGSLSEAAASARRAVELAPNNGKYCRYTADLLLRQGDLEQAEVFVRKAMNAGGDPGADQQLLSRLSRARNCRA
jgi:tetratricopeptide (TPR) repeat protein